MRLFGKLIRFCFIVQKADVNLFADVLDCFAVHRIVHLLEQNAASRQ